MKKNIINIACRFFGCLFILSIDCCKEEEEIIEELSVESRSSKRIKENEIKTDEDFIEFFRGAKKEDIEFIRKQSMSVGEIVVLPKKVKVQKSQEPFDWTKLSLEDLKIIATRLSSQGDDYRKYIKVRLSDDKVLTIDKLFEERDKTIDEYLALVATEKEKEEQRKKLSEYLVGFFEKAMKSEFPIWREVGKVNVANFDAISKLKAGESFELKLDYDGAKNSNKLSPLYLQTASVLYKDLIFFDGQQLSAFGGYEGITLSTAFEALKVENANKTNQIFKINNLKINKQAGEYELSGELQCIE